LHPAEVEIALGHDLSPLDRGRLDAAPARAMRAEDPAAPSAKPTSQPHEPTPRANPTSRARSAPASAAPTSAPQSSTALIASRAKISAPISPRTTPQITTSYASGGNAPRAATHGAPACPHVPVISLKS
jgi:hypothetical protein